MFVSTPPLITRDCSNTWQLAGMLRTAAIPLNLMVFFFLARTITSMESPLYMLTRTQRSMDRENSRQMGDNKWGLKIEEEEDLSWLNHMALVRNNITCLSLKSFFNIYYF